MDDFSMDVGESTIDSVIPECQFFVVDSKLMKDRRVDIVAVSWVVSVGGFVSPNVTFAVRDPAFDSATAKPV